MKHISKMVLAGITALVFLGAPCLASAMRIYYLVGVRHVYRIGTDKYLRADERKQIEQDYADEVSADNAHYQYQISHGGDSATESTQLQSALQDLATERERRLGALYPQCDWVRKEHHCFAIKVDGPYQVIGVDYHVHENVEVWDHCVCYKPWPDYYCVGPNPYGWGYGVAYTPGLFLNVYDGWYGGWVGFGCPAFVGFYGFGGPVVCAGLSINIGVGFGIGGAYGGFYYNTGLGGFYHAGPGYFSRDVFNGRYIASVRDPRAGLARRAGFTAGAAAIRSARAGGFATGIRAGSRSSFASRTAFGSAGTARTGYSHTSGAGVRTTSAGLARAGASRRTSGYAHSAVGAAARARGASITRSRTAGARSTHAGSVARSRSARSSAVRSSGSARRSSASHSSAGRVAHRTSQPRSMSRGRSFSGGHSFAAGRSSGAGRSFGGGRGSGGGPSSGGRASSHGGGRRGRGG